MIPYIETKTQITAIVNQKSLSFDLTRVNAETRTKIITACMKGDKETLINLASPKETVKKVLAKLNNLEVTEEGVIFKGAPIANSLTMRIISYLKEGHNYMHLLKFLDKLLNNPSFTSQEHLYKFLENRNLPITEDGAFLAYKGVRQDYLDKHSGKFNNSPGQVLTMERREVDDNAANDCSYGFHVGSLEYASSFAARVVVVKVDPSDVVAVTTDHNFQKMRVCKYEVLSDYERELNPVFETTKKEVHIHEDYCDDCEEEVDDCECCDDEYDYDPYNPQVGQVNSYGNQVIAVSGTGKVRMSATGGLWLDPKNIAR